MRRPDKPLTQPTDVFNVRRKLRATLDRTALPDVLVRLYERSTGISHPSALIGRRNVPSTAQTPSAVLAIAAHPDDEVLGLGCTLYKHRACGDAVTVVFMTNGSGPDWGAHKALQRTVAEARFHEACNALGIIGITPAHILNLGFPDRGLMRYIPEAVSDVTTLFEIYRPKLVYVHAIEGGHRDHDATSFIVQYASTLAGLSCVYEWAEYNRDAPMNGNISEAKFPHDPYISDFTPSPTPFDYTAADIRQAMLNEYVSQKYLIERYPFTGEILRRAHPEYLLERFAYFRSMSLGRAKHLTRGLPKPNRSTHPATT